MRSSAQFQGDSSGTSPPQRDNISTISGRIVSHRPDRCISYLVTRATPMNTSPIRRR